MSGNKQCARRALVLVFGFLFLTASDTHALQEHETAGWYIGQFGVAAETARTRRQHEIFNQLKYASSRIPDSALLILKGDTGWRGYAIALPDENVVISENAINLAYQGVSDSMGDARMAFILGHELAHQSEQDFTNHIAAFSGKEQSRLRFDRELQADRLGFIYATVAGFDTQLLLGQPGRKGFIDYWTEATRPNTSSFKAAEVRTELLNRNLREANEKVELFKYGVRLAHFGRHDDAIQLLKDFKNRVPSYQVLSNLGYAYLQKARREMPDKLAYRFWFPTWLQNESGLRFESRAWYEEHNLPPRAQGYLNSALQYLVEATRINSTDLSSRLNLVVVYHFLGQPWKAMAIVDELTDIYQQTAIQSEHTIDSIKGLRALSLYLLDAEIDTFETAVNFFETLSKSSTVPDHVLYNYGRILKERQRSEAIDAPWSTLFTRFNRLPVDLQRALCLEVKTKACESMPDRPKKTFPFELPLQLGDDVDAPANRKLLGHWTDSGGARIGTTNARVFVAPGGDSILAIDNHVAMGTLVRHNITSTTHLKQIAGEPLVVYPLIDKEIWSYSSEWAVLVDSSRVIEIWINGR